MQSLTIFEYIIMPLKTTDIIPSSVAFILLLSLSDFDCFHLQEVLPLAAKIDTCAEEVGEGDAEEDEETDTVINVDEVTNRQLKVIACLG